MATTQIRMAQLTGSMPTDSESAAASTGLAAGNLGVVLNHMASAIKRMHGGATFTAQAAGIYAGRIQVDDTTEATSTTDGSLQTDGGLSVANSAVIGNDLDLLSDGAIFALGAGQDVKITHDGGTGATLASAGAFVVDGAAAVTMDSDAALTLGGASIDVDADGGAIAIDGTAGVNLGTATSGVAISIGHSTSETTVNDNLNTTGRILVNDTTAATSTTDGSLQTDGGLSVALDAVVGDDLIMLSDAAVVHFGADKEVTLTHVADKGLTLTNTNAGAGKPVILQLKSEEDAIVAADVIASIELAAGDSDGTDGATVAAGIHAIAEETFAADANATKLVFTAADSETAAATATAKMTLASTGNLTTAGSITAVGSFIIGSADMSEADLEKLDGITNGTAAAAKAVVLGSSKEIATIGTIGCGAITSTGNSSMVQLTTSGRVIVDDTTAATSTTDGSLQTDGGLSVALDAVIGDDLFLLSDSAALALGAGKDATLTHDGTTGLTIAATPISINSTGDLTLDSSTDIVLDADGADVIFKDGGTESARLTMDGTTSVELAAIGDIILDPAGNNVLPGSDSADSLGSTTGDSTIADDFASYVVTGGTDYSSTTTFVSFTGISSEMGDVLADDTITLNDGSNTWTATVAAAASATATKASSFGSILASTTLTSSTSAISPYGGGWSVALMQAVSGDALVIGSWVGTVSSAPSSTSGTLGVSYSSGADQVPNGGLTTTLIGDAIQVSSASGTLDVSAMNGGQTVSVTRSVSGIAWANLYVDNIDLNAQGSISIGGTGRIDLDADDDTSIRASADDVITFEAGGSDEMSMSTTALYPATDDGLALGSANQNWSDLFLADSAVLSFGDDQDITFTHNGTTTLTVAGGTLATAALTTSTIVASGIIKTDDSTAATSTTDGSLQTDGGLSVVLDAVIGDDLILLSDSAQIAFGADSEVTLAHVADSGLLMTSAVTAVPVFELKNTNADATGATLKLNKNGSSPADGDICGNIDFASEDDASNAHTFARINATIDDASSGAEQGGLDFYVAEYDGTLTKGLQIQGTNANGIIDVTLGAGATSTTTVAGHLTVTGTTTTINSTVLTVADDLITVSKGNDTVANADGSGMEIDVTGGTNLYWKYVHSNTALSSNVDIDAASGKAYKIAGTSVLNATTLGSAVVASSLTSLGTIASLVATTADINAGTIDNATIGATTHTTGKFTTVDATTDFTVDGLVLTADTITNDAALSIVSSAGNTTIDAAGDIVLSADGDNITMDNGTTTVFDFAVDATPTLKIMDGAQVANYFSIGVGVNGATTLTTVDTDAAAANLIVTADGTVDIDSAGILTLDSGAAINLEPAAGSAVLIDGTVSIDGGVVTGITALTATAIDGVIGGDTARAGTFAAVIGTTGVYSGILKTDDSTAATSTTDGSLQTDGGLSVAGDAIIGDDLYLLSDSAILGLGAGKDVTITHDGGTGATLASLGAFVIDGAAAVTMDSDAALTLGGTSIDMDADSGAVAIDGTGGLNLATATSGVAVSIGHTTSETTVNDNLSVTGDAAVTGTLSMAADLVHTGDTNNKVAFGTDTQSFETGGTARINLSDSGLQIGDGARVTTILDEDAMGTNSATALATQQSIKAYVDSQAFTPDMWVNALSADIAADGNCDMGTAVSGSTSGASFTSSTTLNAIQVFVNGQLQYIGAGKDVVLSATAKRLNFTYALKIDDVVVVHTYGD